MSKKKIPMIQSGIEPATFRFVVLCLTHTIHIIIILPTLLRASCTVHLSAIFINFCLFVAHSFLVYCMPAFWWCILIMNLITTCSAPRPFVLTSLWKEGHKQCTYKVTVRRVHWTIVPVEKQYYIFWMCVCSLIYPSCKVHAPYNIVICGLSSSTIFSHIIS